MLPVLERALPHLTLHLYFGRRMTCSPGCGRSRCSARSARMRSLDPRLETVRLHVEDYVLVGSPKLFKVTPLRRLADAAAHTLLDISEELPLFSYWRDAAGAASSTTFARLHLLGLAPRCSPQVLRGPAESPSSLATWSSPTSGEAPRRRTPLSETTERPLPALLPEGRPRRSVYDALAEVMREQPLR